MAKLQSALAWAERGYRVFPLALDSRRPAEPGWDWSANASTDPEMIAFWWGTGDWNIGCCTGGGVVVVDLDQKNDHDGIGAYMERGGTFSTLAVRTTTGGMHLYFAGDGRNSAGKVAPKAKAGGKLKTVTANARGASPPVASTHGSTRVMSQGIESAHSAARASKTAHARAGRAARSRPPKSPPRPRPPNNAATVSAEAKAPPPQRSAKRRIHRPS